VQNFGTTLFCNTVYVSFMLFANSFPAMGIAYATVLGVTIVTQMLSVSSTVAECFYTTN